MPENIKIAFFGDIVGKGGRRALTEFLPAFQQQHSPDLIIANGENSAGGLGIDVSTAKEILAAGVDLITTGNHIWKKKEIRKFLDENPEKLIRPLNFPKGAPGVGSIVVQTKNGRSLRVINLLGRVFMPDLVDCPFQAIENELNRIAAASGSDETSVATIVDFHAEATSEKVALARFLDGKVSLLVGTHTHVQTNDARILSSGTGYITDVGMCGPKNGVIGMDTETVIERFYTGLPNNFSLATGENQLDYLCAEFDGRACITLKAFSS